MKRYVMIFLIGIFFFSCGGGGGGSGDDDFIPESGIEEYCQSTVKKIFPVYFTDANKTGGDKNMCWAAVAANALVTAGWGKNEQDIFEYFKNYYENKPGNVYSALQHYFWDKLDDFPVDTVTVREYQPDAVMDFIYCELLNEKAIIVFLKYPNAKIGHYISVFGCHFKELGSYQIWYSDSDDGKYKLNRLYIQYDINLGVWKIPDGRIIDYVISLERKEV